MKLKPEALASHLRQTLLPMYLISGDEPLLVQETVIALRKAAQTRGFSEHHKLTLSSQNDVDGLMALTHTGSLFGDQKLLELQLPGKVPAGFNDYLIQLGETLPTDLCFIVTTPKLEAAAQKTNWYKRIELHGAHIALWPIEASQLPAWISNRAKLLQLSLNNDALQHLCHCTEGNLLAAVQVLEKLALQAPGARIDIAMVSALIEDSSRYDVFELITPFLHGNRDRAWHILQKLQQEDAEPTMIIWALAKEVRLIYRLQQQRKNQQLSALFQQYYIWPKRQPEIETALKRFSTTQCLRLLQKLAEIDTMIKGGRKDNPWLALGNFLSGIVE